MGTSGEGKRVKTILSKQLLLTAMATLIQFCWTPAFAQVSPYYENASADVVAAGEECAKLHKESEFAPAEKKLIALLAKLEKQKNPKPVDLALTLGNIAALYKDDKKPEQAIPYAQRVIAIDKKRFASPSILVAEDIKLLADCCFAAKKFDESAKAYDDVIKIAVKADESQYFPCIVAAHSNSTRKKQLILDSYQGLAKSNFQPGQEDAADEYFSKSIAETMEAPDSAYRHARARVLFKYYGDFLKSTKQADKIAKLEKDIKEYEKKIQVNREWIYDNLDFE